jgi:hypothetical protein
VCSLDRESFEAYEAVFRDCALGGWAENINTVHDMHGVISAAFACATSERRATVTLQGRFGHVPLLTIPGDIVAVLTRRQVSIMLRPEEGYHTVTGDAYVHGTVGGEAMPALDKLEYIGLH